MEKLLLSYETVIELGDVYICYNGNIAFSRFAGVYKSFDKDSTLDLYNKQLIRVGHFNEIIVYGDLYLKGYYDGYYTDFGDGILLNMQGEIISESQASDLVLQREV